MNRVFKVKDLRFVFGIFDMTARFDQARIVLPLIRCLELV